MKQLHHPKEIRTFSLGANYDINKEFLHGDKGTYIDACNMRPNDMSGDNGALKKIKGEERHFTLDEGVASQTSRFGASQLTANHSCVGSIEVNNRVVSFWTYALGKYESLTASTAPAITVDGLIVAQSVDIPFVDGRDLQMDKNESCVGGEIFVTDDLNPPMFFNVGDMLENAGAFNSSDATGKYFVDFNIDLYIINIKNTINAPFFEQYVSSNSIGTSSTEEGSTKNAGNGLLVGTYAYAVRFVDAEGNRTEISEFTPNIPIFENVSSQSAIHPWVATKGAEAGTETDYGNVLTIRADATVGFDSCEVIRVEFNSGDASIISAPPVAKVVIRFKLQANTAQAYRVMDRSMESIEIVDDVSSSIVLNNIQKAKTVRYFDNKLYFGNVKLGGKAQDVGDIGGGSEGNLVNAYPVMDLIYKAGHNDPYNFTYRKSYMHNERYGYGVVFRDSNGSKTFTVPLEFNVEGFNAPQPWFQFPAMRKRLSEETMRVSYNGYMYGTTDENDLWYTHDTCYHINAARRTSPCAMIAFMDNRTGSKCNGTSGLADSTFFTSAGCSALSTSYKAGCSFAGDSGNGVKVVGLGAKLIHPQKGTFSKLNKADGHHWIPTQGYNINKSIEVVGSNSNSGYMFAPYYYAMGLAIDKIKAPSWATSFSIVRTAPAFRVVAQGMSFYSMIGADGSNNNSQKYKNRVKFYSVDLDSDKGLFSIFADDVEGNSEDYKLVLEAPHGFNTEIYSGNKSGGADEGFDMMTFAYMQRDYRSDYVGAKWSMPFALDRSQIGSTPTGLESSIYDFVAFGRWRNNANNVASPWTSNKRVYNISQFNLIKGDGQHTGERGGHHWEIILKSDIYRNQYIGTGSKYLNDSGIRDMHEPVYQCSIIKDNKEPEQGESVTYVSTGHIQHIKSLVYLSQGTAFSQPLVDERWEDCISDVVYNNSGTYTRGTRNSAATVKHHKFRRFMWEVLDGETEARRWIHARHLPASAVANILQKIATQGYAEIADHDDYPTTGSLVKVYGIYNDSFDGQNYKFQYGRVIFSRAILTSKFGSTVAGQYGNDGVIPKAGSRMYVHYDERIPIRVFGGDTFTTEAQMTLFDLKYNHKGQPFDSGNDFRWGVGMPYHKVRMNERNIIINDTQWSTNFSGKIQNQNDLSFVHATQLREAKMRQWMVRFISNSRTPAQTEYVTDETYSYPLMHYRPRPYEWSTKQVDDGNNDRNNVHPDYWTYLGAEDLKWSYGGFGITGLINTDYAATNSFHGYQVKPSFFEEETNFCTRVVWSAKRPINVKDSPTIRTFNASNFYDLGDETGELKYLYDTEGTKGENLYGLTESGVALLLTNKRLIHEISGNELATIGSEEEGILKVIWLAKMIGVPDEMWRTIAESPEALYFANKDSVYKLKDDIIDDLGKKKYYAKLKPKLSAVLDGYETKVTATYNKVHEEYFLDFVCDDNPFEDFIFGSWRGGGGTYIALREQEFNNPVFPNETTNHQGDIYLPQSADLMMKVLETGVLYLGGQSGDLLTNTNGFKLCVSQDSAPNFINIYDPINSLGYAVNAGECKCLSPRLGIKEVDNPRDGHLGDIKGDIGINEGGDPAGTNSPIFSVTAYAQSGKDPKKNQSYKCSVFGRVEPLYDYTATTRRYGMADAFTYDYVIKWTCYACAGAGDSGLVFEDDRVHESGIHIRYLPPVNSTVIFGVTIWKTLDKNNPDTEYVKVQEMYTTAVYCSDLDGSGGGNVSEEEQDLLDAIGAGSAQVSTSGAIGGVAANPRTGTGGRTGGFDSYSNFGTADINNLLGEGNVGTEDGGTNDNGTQILQ